MALGERRIYSHQTSELLWLKESYFLVNRGHGVKQMASGGGGALRPEPGEAKWPT